jgi:hypothetical protein
MYRCDKCHNLVPPNTPARRATVETRPTTYPYRREANRFTRKHKIELRDDPGGIGTEIVHEHTLCPTCAQA